ncbi:hypothetical protein A4X06_0g9390, partial [Tilletia controversa]
MFVTSDLVQACFGLRRNLKCLSLHSSFGSVPSTTYKIGGLVVLACSHSNDR